MTDVQTYGHPALQALNATFSKEQAETLLALLAAVGKDPQIAQDLQSVLDTGNVSSPEQTLVMRGELVGEDAETAFSVHGFRTTLDLMGTTPVTLASGGLASTADVAGLSSLTVSFPLPSLLGGASHHYIDYPYETGTLVLDTQLADTAGAAGVGYDNTTTELAATTVQEALDEIVGYLVEIDGRLKNLEGPLT